nr:immunoglobulin light chain junction region [Macaca mulatta]MOW31413.1 immunoglobulin light chain junction region [Macaca mulatta]MOW56639.1 immunoglobulin light chain junction region [Macaca mulatta]MOW57883.1 immunoglobulin light chain junction region [Macaca mulatta]MOX18272.1 immunoglobulin light chain junction region [Macaca mulatta]
DYYCNSYAGSNTYIF